MTSADRKKAGRIAATAVAVAAWAVAPATGQALSRDEALALAHPGAAIAGDRLFLTAAQVEAAAARAGAPLPTALVARYVARKDGAVVGRSYVDTHTVRTKKESLLISLDAQGRVKRIDVVAFLEPPEYQPSTPFLDQFTGRRLDEEIRVHRAIRSIAGATLTANAVTEAVRRVLAIDEVIAAADRPRIEPQP